MQIVILLPLTKAFLRTFKGRRQFWLSFILKKIIFQSRRAATFSFINECQPQAVNKLLYSTRKIASIKGIS